MVGQVHQVGAGVLRLVQFAVGEVELERPAPGVEGGQRVQEALHAVLERHAGVVCAEREGGAETSIRFGDASGKLTVWSKETFGAVDLLETLLDVPGGREALAKATEPAK